MRLQGKRAIVTGAASGIGRAGALLFAKEGAAVVAVDIDAAGLTSLMEEIARAGDKGHMLVADLTRADVARNVVREGARLLGGLDIFWANAGINGPSALEQLDLCHHDKTIALNLTAPTVSCGEAVSLMRGGAGGSIVLTASTAGLVGSIQSPVYSATKFAVVGLAKSGF